MHYYDTQNSRQENFAHIRVGAIWLDLSWSLFRGLKSQHEYNSREITNFKLVLMPLVHVLKTVMMTIV